MLGEGGLMPKPGEWEQASPQPSCPDSVTSMSRTTVRVPSPLTQILSVVQPWTLGVRPTGYRCSLDYVDYTGAPGVCCLLGEWGLPTMPLLAPGCPPLVTKHMSGESH